MFSFQVMVFAVFFTHLHSFPSLSPSIHVYFVFLSTLSDHIIIQCNELQTHAEWYLLIVSVQFFKLLPRFLAVISFVYMCVLLHSLCFVSCAQSGLVRLSGFRSRYRRICFFYAFIQDSLEVFLNRGSGLCTSTLFTSFISRFFYFCLSFATLNRFIEKESRNLVLPFAQCMSNYICH